MEPLSSYKPSEIAHRDPQQQQQQAEHKCIKVSASAVFCLDILQLYSIGLSFDWHCVFCATVNVLNEIK